MLRIVEVAEFVWHSNLRCDHIPEIWLVSSNFRRGKRGSTYLKNLKSSALTSSACVQHSPCGAPSISTYSLPLTSS
jgi:hypothetical protein